MLPVREGEGAVLHQISKKSALVRSRLQVGVGQEGEDHLSEGSNVTLLTNLLLTLELLVGVGGLVLICCRFILPEQFHETIELADVYPDSQALSTRFAYEDRVEVKAAVYKFLLNRKVFESSDDLHNDLL